MNEWINVQMNQPTKQPTNQPTNEEGQNEVWQLVGWQSQELEPLDSKDYLFIFLLNVSQKEQGKESKSKLTYETFA